jgi:hypothetical protein
MKKLTIGFSIPKNNLFPLFSWAIRAYEGTPFSHVYVRWQTSVGPSICYHAAHATLHFLSDTQFNKQITTVDSFEFEVSDEQFGKLLKYCLETCGNDYALVGVLAIPLVDFFKLNKNPIGGGPLAQYCAELVYRIVGEMTGEKLTYDADRVKLKQVYDFVKEKHLVGVKL